MIRPAYWTDADFQRVPASSWPRPTGAGYAVYRLYDAAGLLLYVGIGVQPQWRVDAHSRRRWGVAISEVLIEWLETEREAREVEKAAIRTEDPIHNRLRYPVGT
jgi:hypothetical protein